MPLNPTTTRERLKVFDFTPLFLEELGWDNCQQSFAVTAGSRQFRLTALAKKCGLIAYSCAPVDGDDQIPDRALRLKIDREVTQTTYEHLLVFPDPKRSTQVWQWVRREPGKPIACREHKYHTSRPGEHLMQKLQQLAVSLEEEERGLALPEIAGRVRAAFDVERVTKRFYDQFQKEKDAFTTLIDGIPVPEDCRWYASVMLNRLMFVYFIQRKGFLDGDPNYLRNRLNRCQQERGKNQFYTFYRHFLLRLFQEGLGQRPPRKAGLDKLLGRIPYLNGGIFDIHTLETEHRYGPKIEIPDSAFERVFDYFDKYDWTLDSTRRPRRPEDKEEINPEILGFIFEKYINQKEMGAYYTQEDITEYISKSTIIPFLFDAARARCKVAFENPNGPTVWNLLQADPDRYIYPAVRHGMDRPLPPEVAAGLDTDQPDLIQRRKPWNKSAPPEYALPTETWREVVARRQHCERVRAQLAAGEIHDINPLITRNLDLRQFAQDVIETCEGPDLLMAFWQAIVAITILDPTGGSGAFIFAALNVLEPLYEACLDRMEAFLAEWGDQGKKLHPNYHKKFTEVLDRVAQHPNRRYFILKSIIVNNLYAVDIMEEAVEICKLRLFLTLAAQVEPDATKENLGIEPLPDIDFNIRAGNTLVGYATADEVRRCMKAEKTSGADQMRLGVVIEKDAYAEFEDEMLKVDAAFRSFRQQQTELGGMVTAEDKRELQKRLATLEAKLNGYLAKDNGVKITDKAAHSRWLSSHQPFHWLIEFYGIISNGGFDVIIGNPPWKEYAAVKKDYTVRNYVTEKSGNLYALCSERSLSLLAPDGYFSFIVQLPLVSSSRMVTLRAHLARECSTLNLIPCDDRPGKLFDGLEHCRATIFVGRKRRKQHETNLAVTRYNRWPTQVRNSLFATLRFSQIADQALLQGQFPKLDDPFHIGVFTKIFAHRATPIRLKLSTVATRNFIFYQEATQYWVKATIGLPFYAKNGSVSAPAHGRYLYFSQEDALRTVAAVLNSSLFYSYFIAYGDCFHLSDTLATTFPLAPTIPEDASLAKLSAKLMQDLDRHAERKTITTKDGDTIAYAEFNVSESKPILDEIDTKLARHYGIAPEELDFILNYDIKYRLGRDADTEEN
jgi:hypothetical protein